jgi:hypothetical protein
LALTRKPLRKSVMGGASGDDNAKTRVDFSCSNLRRLWNAAKVCHSLMTNGFYYTTEATLIKNFFSL